MKKLLTLLGALALSFTLSNASEMKCEAGKCGGTEKKEMKKKEGSKCGTAEKKAPAKGKCGEGKCGS